MSGVMLQIILDTVTTVTCCGCCCYRLHSDVQEEDGQVGAERQHPQHTQVDGADYEHLTINKTSDYHILHYNCRHALLNISKYI